MKVLLSIFLLMSLIACSGSKSTNEAEGTEAGTELSENEEFSEDFSEDEGDEIAELDEDEESSDDAIEEVEEDEIAENTEEEAPAQAMDQESEMQVAESAPVQVNTNGDEGWHTVARNETLMIVAFKIYGDYEKWRELARWNADRLGPNYSVSVGMKLKYQVPAQKFVWNPEGNPYLIKVGDTLGTISKDTYGTMGYWKNIWQNNRPLIKDPNKIFAGFTIYTPLIEGRGVANNE